MSRQVRTLLALVVFSPGCVPVTEPVGDIDQAEPDQSLVGTWAEAKKTPEMNKLKIELPPEKKGNPKGLMLLTPTGYPFPGGKAEVQFYFFTTVVGKERYGNILVDAGDPLGLARLDKEGDYARWSKGAGRRYLIFRCSANKDGLTFNFGDETALKALMKDENIPQDDKKIAFQLKDSKTFCYKTPAGWLANYLEKNGPGKIFPAEKDAKYVKAN